MLYTEIRVNNKLPKKRKGKKMKIVEQRIEIAEKIAEILGDAKVWSKGEKVRLYYRDHKGYAIIDTDGNVNVDGVNAHRYGPTMAAAEEAGVSHYRA